LWADRFDRDQTDLFVLQDEIVGKIVKAIAGALPAPDVPARRRAKTIEAYDLFVRGRALLIKTPESNREARQMLERAIEIDPEFADAHAWLAKSHQFGWSYGGEARDPHQSLALAAARRAVELDPESADAHTILGNLLFYEGKVEASAAELGLALRIDPNHADAWVFLAETRATEGLALDALELARKAFQLNPNPPGWYYWMLGYTLYAAGRYQEAVEVLQHDSTYSTGSTRLLAASLAQLGRIEEAKEEGRRFLSMYPGFSIKYWADLVPFRHEADRQHFVEGYLKAGLPM
jgi:tetratricopeptide (TPR) repeat protein